MVATLALASLLPSPPRIGSHCRGGYRASLTNTKCNLIERDFGMMKVRWRCLLFKALVVAITACCVLHNICVTAEDIIEPTEDVEDIKMPPPRPLSGEQSGHGWQDRLADQVSAPDHNPVELLWEIMLIYGQSLFFLGCYVSSFWQNTTSEHWPHALLIITNCMRC